MRRARLAAPGLTRRRNGRGFVYLDEAGERITDEATLERIRALAIPPAWTDVWICPYADGHVQATGTDAAGRRQYLYHDLWRSRRDEEKFEHMLDFARVLPKLRRRVRKELEGTDELTYDRVLACAVRLLDLGFFRIGTENHRGVGLATMRKEHVRVSGDVIRFDYPAKSGKRRVQSVVDPDVLDVVKALKARRNGGPELLAYRRDGTWYDVRSADVNAWLKAVTGEDVTAKDFRTWNATVLAAVALATTEETDAKRAVNTALTEVAHFLGNTPAVCRASYVDPRVVDHYRAGHTVRKRRNVEAAVLDLLRRTPCPTPATPATLSPSASRSPGSRAPASRGSSRPAKEGSSTASRAGRTARRATSSSTH